MPDRPLVAAWPVLVNSTGQPGTGTKFATQHLDAIRDAIEGAIYDPNLTEDPPAIAREVAAARTTYGSLDARLDSIEAAAAGGAALSGSGGAQANLVPNDTFLLWSGGDAAAPDYWSAEAGLTVARENTVAGAGQQAYLGRNVVKLTASAQKDFDLDIVSAGEIAALNTPQFLKSRKVAIGIAIYTGTQGLVEIHSDDGVTSIGTATKVGGNYGVTDVWVWSADGHADKGGRVFPSAPTRLRFKVRMTGAGTAYLACPAGYFAETAPFYVPAPARAGTMLFGVDASGQVSTGDKVIFNPARSIHIIDGRVRCSTAAATAVTAEVYKDGSAIFGGLLTTGASADSGLKTPTSRALASFGSSNLLKVAITAADATARGAYIALRYVEYPRALDSGFYGA